MKIKQQIRLKVAELDLRGTAIKRLTEYGFHKKGNKFTIDTGRLGVSFEIKVTDRLMILAASIKDKEGTYLGEQIHEFNLSDFGALEDALVNYIDSAEYLESPKPKTRFDKFVEILNRWYV